MSFDLAVFDVASQVGLALELARLRPAVAFDRELAAAVGAEAGAAVVRVRLGVDCLAGVVEDGEARVLRGQAAAAGAGDAGEGAGGEDGS